MKNLKFFAIVMSALLVLSGCNMNNTAKGGIIGGTSGAAVGAGVGYLIGKNTKGTLIGAAVGAAVGTGAGILIGKKMDKAKAKAQAIANAKVESTTDANGLDAVKVTFDSGILFRTNQATLNAAAKTNLKDFAAVLKEYNDADVAIIGHTDNTGSDAINDPLSVKRATAVSDYLKMCGVAGSQIANVEGKGSKEPVADNSTATGRAENRRVEVYLYASKEMIAAAEAEAAKK